MKQGGRVLWPAVPGLLACFLPWMQGSGNALTPNLWDLAEWCSLSPQSQLAVIPLGASLGLRSLPLFLLALAVWRPGMSWAFRMAPALVLALAMLPPPEFVAGNLADGNYRQQLALAALALVCGLAGAFATLRQPWVRPVVAGTSMALAWLAFSAAHDLQEQAGLAYAAGAGLYLFLVLMLATVIAGIQNIRATRTGPPPEFFKRD